MINYQRKEFLDRRKKGKILKILKIRQLYQLYKAVINGRIEAEDGLTKS